MRGWWLAWGLAFGLALPRPMSAAPAGNADAGAILRDRSCVALQQAVDAAAPVGPVFVASYPTATLPALKGTAFVYDNAVALIALIACRDPGRAGRIGAALRIVAGSDRFWHDGRIRNAYRAGSVAAPPALPGWWNATEKRWNEDGYEVGTATGNVAWAALALLALEHVAPDRANRDAAWGMMRWVATNGPTGGYIGEEPHPAPLGWVSTEQNTDAAAAFRLLTAIAPDYLPQEAAARGIVAGMWDEANGHFFVGLRADGRSLNRDGSGLDAELFPLLAFPHAPPEWNRARSWVRAHYAIAGGFGFRAAPDGLWTEGTAQAALTLDDPSLYPVIEQQRAPSGLLYAAGIDHISTGLALTPGSSIDDFVYYRLPHLGATGWSVLAATHTNPFDPGVAWPRGK